MKRLLLLIVLVNFGFLTFAQMTRALLPEEARKISVERKLPTHETYNFQAGITTNHILKSSPGEIIEIGNTRYDLQTNSSTQNRLYFYDDGTIGGTWTTGWADPGFADRGTGYNYFDGTAWGPAPTARIDGARTGWPSYAPWGENGELVVAHTAGTGGATLNLAMRTQKGTGTWTDQTFLTPPPPATGLLWPRMVTSGPDNNIIHIIALTTPTGNAGAIYEGMDGALLYYRSSDGGNTWDIEGVQPPGITSAEYTGISGDSYTWLEPKGDKIAFLVSDSNIDLILMVSEDGGTNWEKIVVWDNPFKGLTETPMYFCPDGATHGVIDNNGKVHVVFGINASRVDAAGTSWYPFIGGIGYWTTDMEPWINGDSAQLDPNNLYDSGHLIGYEIDVDGNGEWFADLICQEIACIGLYYLGVSSMPQLIIDDDNQMMLVYSSVTEGYHNGAQQYRKLWARFSPDGGYTWGDFHMITIDDLMSLFDEEVFVSVAPNSDNSFHLIYQADFEPGLAVRGDEDPYGDNYIKYMTIPKLMVGSPEQKPDITIINISQNFPNPVKGVTQFEIELINRTQVNVEVYNLMGQKVMTSDRGQLNAGQHRIQLDMSNFAPGLYFYTVNAGSHIVTRKMIVE